MNGTKGTKKGVPGSGKKGSSLLGDSQSSEGFPGTTLLTGRSFFDSTVTDENNHLGDDSLHDDASDDRDLDGGGMDNDKKHRQEGGTANDGLRQSGLEGTGSGGTGLVASGGRVGQVTVASSTSNVAPNPLPADAKLVEENMHAAAAGCVAFGFPPIP